jgi:CheY-like chemotaxis protein
MTQPSAAQAQARAIIERQSALMARLLDDLLDLSRITRGIIELRREVLDVRRIVEQVVLANRALVERLHHETIVNLSGDPLLVEADPTRLHQILDNLLQNAAKYTDPGGRIEVSASAEADVIVLCVADTGIGLSPESLERVFGLFSQIHSSERGRSGLGIGLTVVKQLVTLHGGTVHAESAGVGQGSRFRVTLPKTTRAPQAEPLEPPDRIITLFRDNPRVLLVDDQPDIVESLALILRGSGYSVHTAEDGVLALQVAETLRPDVMVVDLGMPRMDGFQLARRVRQQPWGNRTILIAVTGWGQAEDRRRARDAGFDHHLVKPVDPDAVIRLMEAWSTTSANLDASTPKNINQ